MKLASLTPDVTHIVKNKGTERPFSGLYQDVVKDGTYLCRCCGLGLFRGDSQFASSCGWPSFDDQMAGNIKQQPDSDGRRTELLCQRCDSHLGHIFHGEHLTAKNARYCINSLAIDFVEQNNVTDSEEAIVAAGCFWGVQRHFKQLSGVLKTQVGYTGGHIHKPTYQQVCTGATGHVEGIRILYDPCVIDYEKVIRYFFDIHNPTDSHGQGPDRGPQYMSRIFYHNSQQKAVAESVIARLKKQGISVITEVLPVGVFWPAEDYHQDYYG